MNCVHAPPLTESARALHEFPRVTSLDASGRIAHELRGRPPLRVFCLSRPCHGATLRERDCHIDPVTSVCVSAVCCFVRSRSTPSAICVVSDVHLVLHRLSCMRSARATSGQSSRVYVDWESALHVTPDDTVMRRSWSSPLVTQDLLNQRPCSALWGGGSR